MRILFIALLLTTSALSLAACQSGAAASRNHMDDTSVRFSGTVQSGGSVSNR